MIQGASALRRCVVVAVIGLTATAALVASSVRAQAGPGAALADFHGARLVMEDLGHYPVWCGNRAVAVGSKALGLLWIDVLGGRRSTLDPSPYANPTGCTADGEWVIYEDKRTSRGLRGEKQEHGVADFLRIKVMSGDRERLVASAGGGGLSPDEKRILFYRPTQLAARPLQPPQWEVYVMATEWPPASGITAAWLSDSSRVLISVRGQFWIDQNGRTDPVQLSGDAPGRVLWVHVDTMDRIYLFGQLRSESDRRLLRCQLSVGGLRCQELALGIRRVRARGVSADGGRVVFIGDDGHTKPETCVWLFEQHDSASRCVWRWAHVRDQLWLSPDGRRLLLTRSRSVDPATGMGLGPVDLYALDLTP